MEESGVRPHRLVLTNRNAGTFSGVLDVISFDMAEILLETQMGMLHVKGSDLHVTRLNLEKGEVDIEGQVTSMNYEEIKALKKTDKLGKISLGNKHWFS